MTKEGKIQATILRWLERYISKVVIKIITANKAGWADIILSIDGVFVLIEVKRPGEEPTPLQAYKLELIEKEGGVGIWADSLPMARAKLARHPRLANCAKVQKYC